MKIHQICLVVSLLVITACAHRYPIEPGEDEVVSTSTGKERPEWAMEKPRFIKKKQLYVSGMVEIDGEQSPSRGLSAADLQAKANLLSELRTKLRAQLQFASEGFSIEQQVLNNIITESIDVRNVSGLYIESRFYEKILAKNAYYPRTKYICYSLATISMDDFKQAVSRNINNQINNKPLSDDFKEKVDKMWDKVFSEENEG